MDIKQLIGETTDYDKKLALEEKKPKSWCKSISAFANCFGGKLIFLKSFVETNMRLRRFKIMDISKKDWKLFRERLSGWQEN